MKNKKLSTVRGMHDSYGESYNKQKIITDNFVKVVALLNFVPMNSPIMEHSEVFLRTLGNASDVVMKEMYSLFDKNNESLTLRPEGTAGVARAFISNGLSQNLPQKYYYFGPMFRYERPQKGRLRQFHQVGVELFGKGSFYEDFEIIRSAYYFLEKLKIQNSIFLKINTIGNPSSRINFVEKLKKYFEDNIQKLSSDSLNRLKRNPLRILDSKDPKDQELLVNAPIIYDFLSSSELANFESLKKLLNHAKIQFKVDPCLVRGLDYYSNTTFEFTLKKNEKFAVLAGGRYDNLVKDLGGDNISGIGWAAGIERLSNLISYNKNINPPVLLIATDKVYFKYILELSNFLYINGIKNQIIDNFNIKKSLKYANKIMAKIAIIIGESEVDRSLVSLKNLKSGEQLYVNKKDLINKIKNE